jgi:hypothetical protein
MTGNVSLGRVGGVEVRISWSWLVILALIVWSLADGVFPSQNPGLSRGVHLAMAIVAALLFFASLLLHELGHAWRARREGMAGFCSRPRARRRGTSRRRWHSTGLRVRDLMARNPVTVDGDLTVGQFMDEVALSRRFTTYPVVMQSGRLDSLPSARSQPPARGVDSRSVRDVMIPLDRVPLLNEDTTAIDALAALSPPTANRGLVETVTWPDSCRSQISRERSR